MTRTQFDRQPDRQTDLGSKFVKVQINFDYEEISSQQVNLNPRPSKGAD